VCTRFARPSNVQRMKEEEALMMDMVCRIARRKSVDAAQICQRRRIRWRGVSDLGDEVLLHEVKM
jgi:hypothetical protein